jgi:uncharacterized protein YxeA
MKKKTVIILIIIGILAVIGAAVYVYRNKIFKAKNAAPAVTKAPAPEMIKETAGGGQRPFRDERNQSRGLVRA